MQQSPFTVQTIGDRFLIITDGDRLKFMNVNEDDIFYSLKVKSGYKFSIIGCDDDYLYASTDYPDAYNGSIIKLKPDDPSRWEILVPNHTDFIMKQALYADHKFFVILERDFQQYLIVYSDSGDRIKQVSRTLGSNTKLVDYSPEEKKHYSFCELFFVSSLWPVIIY
jgi:hypothetical protein